MIVRKIILLRSASRYWTIISPTQKPRWFVVVGPTMDQQHFLNYGNFSVGPMLGLYQWPNNGVLQATPTITGGWPNDWLLSGSLQHHIDTPYPDSSHQLLETDGNTFQSRSSPSPQTTYRKPYRRETTRICSRISIAIVDMDKEFGMRKRW